MNRPRFLPFLTMLLLPAIIPGEAHAAEDTSKLQQELSQAIQRQVLSLNVNQNEKFLIDYHFSTFHGMYAYHELLLWAQGAPAPLRDELLALAHAGLEAVVRDSGMGLPLGEGQAAGLLFGRGLPRYVALPDFSRPETLKWDPASFERVIAPESVGQSLAAKSLYMQTDTSGNSKKLAEILLASALHEFQTIQPMLEQGGDKGASHMPALLKLENGQWVTINPASQLYGQMSLLQGLARLYAVLAPETRAIAGKSASDWRKEIRRALEKVYQTAVKLHFDSKAGSFASGHDRAKGISGRLGAEDAGHALEALADMVAALPGNDPLRTEAVARIKSQAGYLAARLEGKNSAPRAFLLASNQTFSGPLLRLEDQLAIVNGLLAAAQAGGGDSLDKVALAVFEGARQTLWSAPAGVFRSAAGQTVTAYDGRLFGLSLAAWRRLENRLPAGEARQHGDKLIEVVLRQGGLQQAEGPATGEPKQPETFLHDELPQLVAAVAPLKRAEQQEKITAAINLLSDQDGDGIPGCRFAGGKFGAAPVIVTQTSVKTPFDPPPPSASQPRSSP